MSVGEINWIVTGASDKRSIGAIVVGQEQRWSERCRPRFDIVSHFRAFPTCPVLFAAMLGEPWPGYTGPNFHFRDYWVREVKRSGEQRRSVYLEIVGTGRVLRIGRKAFERERGRA